MKLTLILGLALGAEATLHLNKKASAVALWDRSRLDVQPENGIPGAIHYGDTRCPCIGFDNIDGTTMVELSLDDGKNVYKKATEYPADLGARCEAWDEDRHPACKEPYEKPGWCEQRWCIVDPCKCALDVLPKPSEYMPTATYVGKPLFFSYATCGGRDFWSDPDGIPKIGKPKCRCIGFAGVPGSTEVAFEDSVVANYPGDMGSKCFTWDKAHHPDCKGKTGADAPSWCRANWCYVDPCSCELPAGVVPKISAYLPEASFTGKNLYYSYETCNSADTWTVENNVHACVNQKTEKECGENSRCAWTGSKCLGIELVSHPLCVDEDEDEAKSGAGSLASWTAAAAAMAAILVQ